MYLRRLEATGGRPVAEGGAEIRAALQGDCHTHSDWSDGGSPIEEMALAARDVGHRWVALTDHSPRLTVAHGLSPERLREQLDVVRDVNDRLAPFRILTGIEVDILEDGSPGSGARAARRARRRRRLGALEAEDAARGDDPADDHGDRQPQGPRARALHRPQRHLGRASRDRPAPESEFDAEIVFEACRQFDVAVEINCRPERLDPPKRLLRLAVEAGCKVAIDTDAHAPGQLDWQPYGCERAAACARARSTTIVNAWDVETRCSPGPTASGRTGC